MSGVAHCLNYVWFPVSDISGTDSTHVFIYSQLSIIRGNGGGGGGRKATDNPKPLLK